MPIIRLSANFSLAELVKSNAALRRGIDNTPDDAAVTALRAVAANILQPVRAHYGVPFSPSSGYRSPALNDALGGAADSQHVRGQAADFEVPGVSNLVLARFIRDNLDFDQLILEHYSPEDPRSGWVHCSYVGPAENRREVLSYDGISYRPGLPEDVIEA